METQTWHVESLWTLVALALSSRHPLALSSRYLQIRIRSFQIVVLFLSSRNLLALSSRHLLARPLGLSSRHLSRVPHFLILR